MRELTEVSFIEAVKHPRKGMGLERFFKADDAKGRPELFIYESEGLIYIEHPDSPHATVTPVSNVRFMHIRKEAKDVTEKALQASSDSPKGKMNANADRSR